MNATEIRTEIARLRNELRFAELSTTEQYLKDKIVDLEDDLYVAEHPEDFDADMTSLRDARMNYRAETMVL